jgi:hypothetical protein
MEDVTISLELPFDWLSTMLVSFSLKDSGNSRTYTIQGTFSLALQAAGKPNGAADGSLLVDPNEVLRADNNGLQNIVAALKPLPAQFGVSPGDVLHVRSICSSHSFLN